MNPPVPPIAYAGNPLDRENNRRRGREWMEAQDRAPESRYLPFFELQPLLKLGEKRELAWARREFFEDLDPVPEPVLLGSRDGVAHFAVDVSAATGREDAFGVADVAGFEELRGAIGAMPAEDAAIAAQGRTLVDWHARHRHCAVCGGHTRSVQGGASRICFDCQAEHFPRTDPVAIAVVVKGDRCLLGRGPGWPASMYSALAGFIEAGETLEDAVRREVREEAGVVVGEVRYLQSQPWPFPSSLMIGCIGIALSEELTVDALELDDAKWFTRDALRAALDGRKPDLTVPPPFAIAHHLIRAWVEGEVPDGS
ncbi:MAG: NAD(+) diphosphatase [Myxococcota bacterium]